MSKKTMKKNHSIGLRFTIAIWWFSVRTAPVMGGCKNETKTKNHGKWVIFPFFDKTKRKRKTTEMLVFPFFEKTKTKKHGKWMVFPFFELMQKYKLRVKGHCFDSAVGLRFNTVI